MKADIPVGDLLFQCSYPMRPVVLAASDTCRKAATTAVVIDEGYWYRCDQHRGLTKGQETGDVHETIPLPRA